MNDVEQSRTASILSIVAGIWLAISPIWIAISGTGTYWSLYVVAALFIVFGFVQLFTENTLPSWIVALSAIWLFISAFTLSISSAAAWNQAITAVVAFLLATWDGVEVSHAHNRHVHGTA